MSKIIREINVETNKVVDREMTKEELAQYEKSRLSDLAIIQKQEEKTAARNAVLEKLGLSAEEAALLLG